MPKKVEKLRFDSDSEVIKQLAKRKVGEIIELSQISLAIVDDRHGHEVADATEHLGNILTEMISCFILDSVKDIESDDAVFAYLLTTVATNMALSVLTTFDTARFYMELEKYQKSGGTE
jgi:hypothetical protein